jgi:ADP-ribose pyrophosphatase
MPAMTDHDAQVHRRETVYHGFVDLVEAEVTYPPPDGQRRQVVFADPRPAAAVLPLRPDGVLVLARQYRPAVGRTTVEIPAGGIDDGEEAEAAACRELREELGLEPGRVVDLGPLLPSPGTSSESIRLFAAFDCRETERPEGAETVDVELVGSLDAALRLIADGALPDAKTQVAVLRLSVRPGPLERPA